MIRLIIFDAGGVLYAGSQEIVDGAVRRFLAERDVHDFDESDRVWSRLEKLASVGRMSLKEAQRRWLEAVGLHRSLLDEWREAERKEIWGRFKRTRGVNRLLSRLKKKYVLAVLSDTVDSKPEKIERMEIVGVDHRAFDEIFTSHDLGAYKPSKKAFYTVLEKFGVSPGETVFVGDSCDELRGARRIGLTAIGFNCGGGDYRVKKLSEIEGILQNLNQLRV
jgi:HAD superfamily hydrolase (TIGR01549 family)